jgi:hypothetical protein
MLVALAAMATARAQDEIIVRTYNAQYTKAPPVIDGKLSLDEWNAAAESGEFLLLRTNPGEPENQNTRWRALWDDEALYLLSQSDYGFWSTAPDPLGGIDFNADNLNLYFDPNTDGEPNFPTDPEVIVPFDQPDGYQIAFNQWEGASSLINGVNTGLGGMFLEAHGDNAFGNQANWSAPVDGLSEGFALSQVNGPEGGLVEIRIPWADFNADEEGVFGLNHTKAPANGDAWYFNISRITSDPSNFLPIWNWQPAQFFAARPHGELVFVGKPASVPGDIDGDGKVDLVDFNILKDNFGTGTTPGQGDLDGDGKVDLADFDILKNNFGKGGATEVPEPSSWLLAAWGALAWLVVRRRR